jgi:hypothetical protein
MKIRLLAFCIALSVGCAPKVVPTAEMPVRISVDGGGAFSTKTAVSEQELRQELESRYNRYGQFPVIIRAADETPHIYVSTALDLCSSVGLWHVSLSDESGEVIYPDESHDWEIDVGGESAREPPSDLVQVLVSPEGGNLDAVTNAPAETQFLIMCSRKSIHRDLMSVLRECNARGANSVYQIVTRPK